MPPIVTKWDLLDYMVSLKACEEATTWVTAQGGTAREIWESCDRYEWLIWLGGRRNPRAIAWFADQCAARAKKHAAANAANSAYYAANTANATNAANSAYYAT